ncbi:hypothetical protein TWF788_005483 [Orbilia oligospora]|uniref:Uncharacterized protein n=1 Tax=Orbilia oligospora TaxID=2813651 RepID=A0A6G1M2I4_ORBOL|nr:hypothetical protein TWF788_005483 [Orbilia oligospora]KAF3243258.1 hypothetical protein TWF192_008430 [Orbilia oligospora]
MQKPRFLAKQNDESCRLQAGRPKRGWCIPPTIHANGSTDMHRTYIHFQYHIMDHDLAIATQQFSIAIAVDSILGGNFNAMELMAVKFY